MKLTNENAFVGAEVKYRGERMFVIKVNEKSCYLAKDEKAIEAWENKPKGMKWADHVKRFEAKMLKYSEVTIEISGNEVKRKTNFIVEKETEMRKVLSNAEREKVRENYEKFKKGKSGIRTPIDTVKKGDLVPIAYSNKGFVLMRKMTKWFFYDVLNDKYFPFDKEKDKEGKDIIFPKRASDVVETDVVAEVKTA